MESPDESLKCKAGLNLEFVCKQMSLMNSLNTFNKIYKSNRESVLDTLLNWKEIQKQGKKKNENEITKSSNDSTDDIRKHYLCSSLDANTGSTEYQNPESLTKSTLQNGELLEENLKNKGLSQYNESGICNSSGIVIDKNDSARSSEIKVDLTTNTSASTSTFSKLLRYQNEGINQIHSDEYEVKRSQVRLNNQSKIINLLDASRVDSNSIRKAQPIINEANAEKIHTEIQKKHRKSRHSNMIEDSLVKRSQTNLEANINNKINCPSLSKQDTSADSIKMLRKKTQKVNNTPISLSSQSADQLLNVNVMTNEKQEIALRDNDDDSKVRNSNSEPSNRLKESPRKNQLKIEDPIIKLTTKLAEGFEDIRHKFMRVELPKADTDSFCRSLTEISGKIELIKQVSLI